MGRARKF